MISLTALAERFEILGLLRPKIHFNMFYTRGDQVLLDKFPKGVRRLTVFDNDSDAKKNFCSKYSYLRDGKIIEVYTEEREYIYFIVRVHSYKSYEYEIAQYNLKK